MTTTSDNDLPGNAPEVIDSQQRLRALTPDVSFIVQAPAGSGKTELLIRRVLTLLTIVDVPEEILAITFTRKAAAEMRHRIHVMLQRAQASSPNLCQGVRQGLDQGLGHGPDHGADQNGEVLSEHEAEGLALAQSVLERSDSLQWGLVENPQRLSMQTIDSLCATLTRQLPVTSALGAPLQTEERALPMYLAAAAELIEYALRDKDQIGESCRALLLELDNKVERLQQMLANMLSNRDQWLRYVGQRQTREDLQANLELVVTERLEKLVESRPELFDANFFSGVVHADHCMRALHNDDNRYEALALLAHAPGADLADGAAWHSLSRLLLTEGGTVRKSSDRRFGFPNSAKDAKELGIEKAVLDQFKAALVEVLQTLAEPEHTGFVEQLAVVSKLPFDGYSDAQWDILEHLFTLLTLAVAELHLGFGQSGKCDFVEIAQRAGLALGGEGEPTDLALAMDYRIQHILIDEFQDTSISQFKLFERLVEGWEHGDGKTFFAVGDPMQSIYRFRDAEVSLFTEAQNDGINSVSLEPVQLEVNFRSDPLLVDWFNSCFSRVFPSLEDRVSGAVPFADSTAFSKAKPDSLFRLHPFLDDDKEGQAAGIVTVVQEAIDADPQQSIAVLVRSKNHLTELFAALRRSGIACQAVEMEVLGNRPVVRDITALQRALMHPSDKIAWLSLLRAPWVGLTLVELHGLIETDRYASVWDIVNSGLATLALSEASRSRLEKFVSVLKPAVNRAVRDEITPWVEACWLQLGGPAVCGYTAAIEHDTSSLTADQVSDLSAAEMTFKALSKLEASGVLWNRKMVESQLGELYAPAQEVIAPFVQIMTIHKSKGLEFDTVILPNLGRKTGLDSQKLLNWFEYSESGGSPHLLLAPLNTTTEKNVAEPINQLIKGFHDEREKNERIRLMYVAATRAKKRLHVFAHTNIAVDGRLAKPRTGSLLETLWPVFEPEFVAHAESVQSAETLVPDSHSELNNDSVDSDSGCNDQAEPGVSIPVALLPHATLKHLPEKWSMPTELVAWMQSSEIPVVPEFNEVPEFLWASMEASSIGVVVHRQLQRICDEGVQAWSDARVDSEEGSYRVQLLACGVSEAKLKAASAKVKKAINSCLSDPRGRWLLDDTHTHSRTELALTGYIDGKVERIVIDRTFIDDAGVCWIIDYKTGDHRGGAVEAFLDSEYDRYKGQLDRYADILGRVLASSSAGSLGLITPGTNVTEIALGLYFPLLQGWREWRANVVTSV